MGTITEVQVGNGPWKEEMVPADGNREDLEGRMGAS